ncbi:MAG: hypothetical protein WC435_02180 [Candidatus Paceibacterota bacterium]
MQWFKMEYLLGTIVLIFFLNLALEQGKRIRAKGKKEEEEKSLWGSITGFFKGKKIEKFRDWTWTFAKIALIWIVAAWFFDWPMNPKVAMKEWEKNAAQSRASSTTFNSGRCITFFPGETRKVIKLKPGEWSEWVKVPPGAEYRISSSCDVKINFWDGEIINDSPENFVWTKPRQAIFRILSEKDGESIIVVS